jgi:hypothetical protein
VTPFFEVWRLRGRRVWVLAKNPTMMSLWNCKCPSSVPDRVYWNTRTKVWPLCTTCNTAEVNPPPEPNRYDISGVWSECVQELYLLGNLEAA